MSKYTDAVQAHAHATGQHHVTSRSGEASDGFGGHGARLGESVAREGHAEYDKPPITSTHVAQSRGHERDHAEHASLELGGHHGNEPEGRTVMHGFDRNAPTMDSPVPEHGRQMPDRNVTSKAEEVREAVRENHGDGFPSDGVMDR